MRFQQFVQDVVVPTAQSNYAKINDLATKINGGWEVWFQVEMYFRLAAGVRGISVQDDDIVFTREPLYPNSALRADFNFTPSNSDTTLTWVELKVERKANYRVALDEFRRDIDKVQGVARNLGPNDTVGAVVLVPVESVPFMDAAKEELGELRDNLRYYRFNEGTSVGSPCPLDRYPECGDERSPNAVTVLYYVHPT